MRTLDAYSAALPRYPLLSPEAERTATADELVTANLRFAYRVALEYAGRGVDLEDLIQTANLALLHAAQRFDPERGFRFITFAVWTVRRALGKAVSDPHAVHRPYNPLGRNTPISVESLDAPMPNGSTPLDCLAHDGPAPDDLADQELLRLAIARSVEALPERERAIIRLHYGFDGEEHTLEAAGQNFGLTKERARQIRNRALDRLRRDRALEMIA